MMCTSGSLVRGSCRLATTSGASTRTGISCVTMVSRLPPNSCSNEGSKPSSLFVAVGIALCEFEDVVVTIVRARTGRLSFLVRRIFAEVALTADLRARLRATKGTSRFMTLFAADWTLMVSKMASCVAC